MISITSADPPRGRAPGQRLFLKYLLASVILVSIVLLASGGLELYYSYQETQNQISSLQQAQAAAASARIEAFIAETARDVAWAAQTATTGEGVEARRADYVRLLRLAPSVTEVTYIDGRGGEQLRVSRLGMNVSDAQSDLSSDPRFAQTRGGQIYYGPVYYRNNSEPFMTIAAGERGATGGVTSAEVNLKFIWDVVSRITIGKAGDAFVVDMAGQLLAHPDISQVLRRSDLSELPQVVAARAPTPASGMRPAIAALDLSDREVLTSFETVPTTGWLIFVEQPLAEAQAPIYASVQRTAILLLLALLIAILGSSIYARRMVAPIQALRAGAARLGTGTLDERITVHTGDELEQLADEFNHMAAQLQESYAGLERKVDERTHELAEALDQQTATSEVLNIIAGSPTDVQPVLDAICEAAARVCNASDASIRLLEGDELVIAAHIGPIPVVSARLPVAQDGNVSTAFKERRTIHIEDLQNATESFIGDRTRNAARQGGQRTVLVTPLLRGGDAIGAIQVRRSEVQPFTDTQIALLETFADQAVITIENVRLFQEIQEKNRELEVASAHKSEFLANMSHELRTPLNAIIGFSEVLVEKMFGELNERQEDYLTDILSSGRHLLSLINDILDLAKVEAGQMDLDVSSFSLADALQNGVTMIRERASNHGIALSLNVDPSIGTLDADERKVKQMVFNLLSNAVKFTPDGGKIDVKARRVEEEVQIAVTDTGIGIAPEDQQAVFEEFRQVGKPGAGKAEGTGLGLALVKRFAEMHGGRIWLESEPGVGSTFTIALPALRKVGVAAEAPGGEDATVLLDISGSRGRAHHVNGPAVLVVEDDPRSIDLLTLYLHEAGFGVTVARNGEDGLSQARNLQPAAIVLDVMLPGLDGWEFIAQAKADPALTHTPIIVTTVVDERGKGLALGAAEYLVKPVSRDQLLAAIETLGLVPRIGPRATKVLAIDDDPMAIELIEAVLVPAGYHVVTASGGEEGIEMARRDVPDLVILDLMMPDVDGFTVVERLRADAATAGIPIVVLTSKAMSREDRERLNGRISFLAHKADFNRDAFVELVQRYCQPAVA